jgi:hypothetical protein
MELESKDLSFLRRELEVKSHKIVIDTLCRIQASLAFRVIQIQIVMCDRYKHPGTLREIGYSQQLFDIYEYIFDVIPSNNLELFDMLVAVENKLDIII